jgi:sodium-dependent dicarboxylate transporter 2/3/5
MGIDTAGDATVAIAAVVVLFILPNGEGEQMLDLDTARNIPWGLLLLFGGGIAIARAFASSGLAAALGDVLGSVAAWPTVALIITIALGVTFLTEITSNTATTNLLMPILAAAAVAAEVEPTKLMIPATLSASMAFMLPVATAPNAIMFGTGRIGAKTMAREGFALNLAGAVAITLVCAVLL